MRVQKRIKNLTEPEKEQFEAYLDKKLEAFMPLLDAHHPEVDEVVLTANIQKHDKHTAFEFDYVLELPKTRLVAGEVKHSITESLDFATDKLEQQLVKHFKKLVRE